MSKSAETVWTVIGVLVALFVVFALAAFPVLLAWNLGLVGACLAFGLVISHIGYWTAFGLVFLAGLLRSIFSGALTTSVTKNLK